MLHLYDFMGVTGPQQFFIFVTGPLLEIIESPCATQLLVMLTFAKEIRVSVKFDATSISHMLLLFQHLVFHISWTAKKIKKQVGTLPLSWMLKYLQDNLHSNGIFKVGTLYIFREIGLDALLFCCCVVCMCFILNKALLHH